MSFDSLGLNPDILRAVAEQGYVEPTPIQQQAIPAVLQGRDLMASIKVSLARQPFRPPLFRLRSMAVTFSVQRRPAPVKRRALPCRCCSA